MPVKNAIITNIVMNIARPLGTPHLQTSLHKGKSNELINKPNDKGTRKFLAMITINVNAIKKSIR
jgi:hypothetical protein